MHSSETNHDRTMDTETLTNLLAQGEPVLVLDVRPAEQREEWHIPGSGASLWA